MPRARRSQSKTPYIGFFGAGTLDSKALTATLDDFLDGRDNPIFVLPLTVAAYTRTMEDVVEYADTHKITFVTVSDAAEVKKDDVFQDLVKDAQTDIDAKGDVFTTLVEVLKDAADSGENDVRAFVLLAADGNVEPVDTEALTAIYEADIAAFNLTNGLDDIKFDPEPEGETAAADPEPEPAAETPRRRRGRSQEAEPEEDKEPTETELKRLTSTELKDRVVEAANATLKEGEEKFTLADVKGINKPELVEMLLNKNFNPLFEPPAAGDEEPKAESAKIAESVKEAQAADRAANDEAQVSNEAPNVPAAGGAISLDEPLSWDEFAEIVGDNPASIMLVQLNGLAALASASFIASNATPAADTPKPAGRRGRRSE